MSLGVAAKIVAWLAAGVVAYLRPGVGEGPFAKFEALARHAARHKIATWLAMGLLVLVVRGALLPLWPIPKPVFWDEFGYILEADTFAHGRLTNPTHPLSPFFESAYVLQHPSYQAKYPPGQGLFLGAGEAIFGDPWFGVWLSCGVMIAALVWAMQAWLPPGWALFGGLLALPLALTTYWMNSYWGGAVAAIGGALLLGGYGRVIKQNKVWYGLAMGAGMALLANTRPYEGLVFTIPVMLAFIFARPVKWAAMALIAAVLLPALAATGFYNRAVTGNAFEMPFTEYARQYAVIPLFNVQPLQADKPVGSAEMQDLHRRWEVGEWKAARSWQLIPNRLNDWKFVATTLLGSVLTALPLLLFFPDLWKDRRIRLPLICVGAALAGSCIEIRYYQHYAAPATAAVFILAVQAFRHLRYWRPANRPMGSFLVRAMPILVVAAALVGQAFLIVHPDPQPVNSLRGQTEALISDLVSKHVILVRYTEKKNPHEEWVYNGADIDSQEVIWAHDLGPVENARLVKYYNDRKIWLYQPDIDPGRLDPYK